MSVSETEIPKVLTIQSQPPCRSDSDNGTVQLPFVCEIDIIGHLVLDLRDDEASPRISEKGKQCFYYNRAQFNRYLMICVDMT